MVSPPNPTRASSAMVAARTFSTTCWLRAPRCTPLVRRVELSIATTLALMASECCHLVYLRWLPLGQSASERTGVVDGPGGGLGDSRLVGRFRDLPGPAAGWRPARQRGRRSRWGSWGLGR